jgi:predicted outer membrane repeat protein
VVQTTAFLANCIFEGNQAVHNGGAIVCAESGLTVDHCLFLGNTADAAGAFFAAEAEISLEFCTFAGNASNDGGAVLLMRLWDSHVASCTFWGNGAARGAAISLLNFELFDLAVERCIVADNNEGEGLFWDGIGTVELSNMDIWDNAGGDWVGAIADQAGVRSNISQDPLFCGVEEDPLDFTLREDSPCLPENNPDGVLIGAHGLGCAVTVGVDDGPASAQVLSLENHPNPFNPVTTFAFGLDAPGPVRLAVYDLAGRQIACLADRRYAAGQHRVTWDGTDRLGRALPSGVFLAILEADGDVVGRKVSLVR